MFINLFSKIETFKYFIMTNPIEEVRKSFAKVFKKLAKQQYKFIFLFDSLDECVQTQSFDRELKPFIDGLDCHGESCIDYKFVIALRTSAYAIRKEEFAYRKNCDFERNAAHRENVSATV